VLLNVAPSLWHLAAMGPNLEGVNRFPAESELYGLKLAQMFLPRGDHRLDSFYDFASRYNYNFPLVTENISSSLGAAGSLGLLLLILSMFMAPMDHGFAGLQFVFYGNCWWFCQFVCVDSFSIHS
jgi:phosphoglycerol transferase